MSRRKREIRTLGEKVEGARIAAGLSIRQLADLVGLSSQQVRRIEAGRSEATAIVLGRVVRALGVSADELLDHVRTLEETADALWQEYELDSKLKGSDDADFLAKKAILESMGFWVE